jgi:hypothetical protein
MTTTTHAIAILSAALGVGLTIDGEREWRTATFSGTALQLRADAQLPAIGDDFEVSIPGYLLADIQAEGRTMRALLLEDAA